MRKALPPKLEISSLKMADIHRQKEVQKQRYDSDSVVQHSLINFLQGLKCSKLYDWARGLFPECLAEINCCNDCYKSCDSNESSWRFKPAILLS